MHKLEKLILESYAEVLREDKKVLRLDDLTPVMRKALEKRYGKSVDPEQDFVSANLETYYFTHKINKETNSVDHKVYDLPSFQSLYFGYSDIIDDVRQLMNSADVRSDKAARELFELIKSNFRQIQKYLRTERPDQYELMKSTRSLEENISALKEYRLSIGSKEVARINKVGLDPEDWTVTFVDGTEEPYMNHLREVTDMNDPVMVKIRQAKMHSDKMKKLDAYSKSPEGRAAVRTQASAERKEQKAREIVRKLKIKRAQVEREMENDPGTEPQGGPVSDMYGDQLNKIDNAIEKAAGIYNKRMTYDQAVGKVTEIFADSTFIDKHRDSVVAHIEELLDDMGTSEVAMEYLGWSEEEAEDADHTVRADAANKIANDPALASEFLDKDDIEKIKAANLSEGEGDDHHYIKVKLHDYKKAMAILDQNVDPTYVKMEVVDNDGNGNVIIYFIFKHEAGFDDMYDDSENPDSEFYQEPDEDPQAFVYDVVMDLGANDITVVDSSTEMDEILKEEENSDSGKLNKIQTFGDLQKFIKLTKTKIVAKKVGGALDAAIGFIPGIGNVKTGIDVIRALAKKQDGKTTNTFLDKMDVDDKASAIVDDKVEANFINYMHKRIEDQDANTKLPSNFNMNSYFNDFLSAEYDKRTIDGINEEIGSETILEDATDIMLEKFPTLKAVLIRLQTEDFKEFVNKIDWISPRPTEFRINLTNGQDYILKWTGKGFEAQILGKRYFLNKINEFQQALDKLAILYKEGPMGEPEEPAEPAPETDSGSSSGSGGDFPGEEGGGDSGEDTPDGDDTADAGEEEGADLTDEPVDFEEPAEEPEA